MGKNARGITLGFLSSMESERRERDRAKREALEKVREERNEKKRNTGRFFKLKSANREKIKPKALGWIPKMDNLTGFWVQNRGKE